MPRTNDGKWKAAGTAALTAALAALMAASVAGPAMARGANYETWYADDDGSGNCMDLGDTGYHITSHPVKHWNMGEDPDANGNGMVCKYVWKVPRL